MSWLVDRGLWLELYSFIKRSLNLSFDLDQRATDTLSGILSSMGNAVAVDSLRPLFSGRCALVLGPANTLEQDFRRSEAAGLAEVCTVVAVDGASSYLYEVGSTPDVIVTDLDGDPNHIAYLNLRGSVVVVHGHGDNIDDVVRWVPRLGGAVLGSTQVEPRPYVYNFGGFTDGDRALYIAYALGARRAVLGGMDFLGPIGRYSTARKAKDEGVKRLKMSIAVKLIEMLIDWGMEVEALSDTGIARVRVV